MIRDGRSGDKVMVSCPFEDCDAEFLAGGQERVWHIINDHSEGGSDA